MRFSVIAVAGLIVAVMGQAQTASTQQSVPADVVAVRGPVEVCPAGLLRARQQAAGGTTMWTIAQEDRGIMRRSHSQPASMGVHVNFDAKSPVQSLELSVSYLPVKLRLMPLASATGAKDDSKKTFVLKQEAALKVNGDLMVGPAATIRTVHLISATYADGTVWRAPNEDSCTVEPSGLLLVGGK